MKEEQIEGRAEPCIVAGCTVPARGKLRMDGLTGEWHTCGNHRRELSLLFMRAEDIVLKARRRGLMVLIDGLEMAGNHSVEDELGVDGAKVP